MRPMIRLGNLNARPSCPAADPGSTVWVYLYAAGHRDMPGDSPAGHRRLSGIKAQSGKIADACVKEKPPRGADDGQMAWRGAEKSSGRNRSGMPIHRAHTGAIANCCPVEWAAGRQQGVGQEFTPA